MRSRRSPVWAQGCHALGGAGDALVAQLLAPDPEDRCHDLAVEIVRHGDVAKYCAASSYLGGAPDSSRLAR